MVVQESFSPVVIVANGAAITQAIGSMGGFCCVNSGSLKVTKTSGGGTIVDTCAVTAGVFLPMPFVFAESWTVTLSGGAAGTLAVN